MIPALDMGKQSSNQLMVCVVSGSHGGHEFVHRIWASRCVGCSLRTSCSGVEGLGSNVVVVLISKMATTHCEEHAIAFGHFTKKTHGSYNMMDFF